MKFTDDDLKRLPFQKMNMEQMKNMALDVPGLISRDDILYLLARLEAAEVLAAYGAELRGPESPAVKAWRKAAGK